MLTHFTKMEGTGNDFIFIDGKVWDSQTLINDSQREEIVRSLCDRHKGIGADGLVIMFRESPPRMKIYNSDGSQAQMCGNATRCAALYLRERELIRGNNFTLNTDDGLKNILIKESEQGFVAQVNLGHETWGGDMGGQEDKTSKDESIGMIDFPIELEGHPFNITVLATGTPHCVLYTSDLSDNFVHRWGPILEKHPLFPLATNVEFVHVLNPQEVKIRVWERGCGETLSCGTGAAAVCAASVRTKRTDTRILCHLRGGDLLLEKTSRGILKEGPAKIVYQGEIEL